jgi:hypothetical protein
MLVKSITGRMELVGQRKGMGVDNPSPLPEFYINNSRD